MEDKLIVGRLLDLTADPSVQGERAVRYLARGALWIKNGKIAARGSAQELQALASGVPVVDYGEQFIVPGFIDCHVHYAQTEMVAAYGEQLLTWLTEHAFPTEEKFTDAQHARAVADVFLNELLKNGTTTASVFATVHPQSVDAFFSAAQHKGLRMICGKVMMDRNCPDSLQDDAHSSYVQSKALIQRWHGVDRLQYAVTPRFAPTSTKAQLASAQKLLQEFPDVYLQTHVAENKAECDWVGTLYPEAENYIDVYHQAGLLGRRTLLAHGIHLSQKELARCAKQRSSVVFCPTSNMFIGSGLFNLPKTQQAGVHVAMASDVGAGTSFSMLRTYHEAYKVQQLQGHSLSAYQGLYLATLAGARALDLEGTIGQLEVGCEADIAVLDPKASDYLKFRINAQAPLHDQLFTLMMLADDRVISATYSHGELVHQRG